MTTEVVIIDLDGTLLNRPPHLPREANTEALKLLCTEHRGLDEIQSCMKDVSSRTKEGKGILASKANQFGLLVKILGIDDVTIIDGMLSRYMERYLSDSSLYPEAASTLGTLARLGLRMALITNSPDDVVGAVLRHFGIDQYFDVVAAASSVGFPKPSIEFSRFLMDRFSSDPSAIVVVGDGDEDGVTASMIGARFFRVNRDETFVPVESGRDETVRNLGDLVAKL